MENSKKEVGDQEVTEIQRRDNETQKESDKEKERGRQRQREQEKLPYEDRKRNTQVV